MEWRIFRLILGRNLQDQLAHPKDSVASFVENEQAVELRALQQKYDKTMERVVTLEDYIMNLGSRL